nr:hypothetical protein [Mycobacterium sp. UM_NZ2]
MNKDEAAELTQQLRDALGAGKVDDGPAEDVWLEVMTLNDRSRCVVLHVKSSAIALDSDWARELAEDLVAAADEVDRDASRTAQSPPT